MRRIYFVVLAGLLTCLLGTWPPIPPTAAQSPSPNDEKAHAPAPRNLTGADAGRAAGLEKAIEAAQEANHWDEAIARAAELADLRTRLQGPAHYEAVTSSWDLKTLRRVAAMPGPDRADYRSALKMTEQAAKLYVQGKHAEARPLFERALAIWRRELGEGHPFTSAGYYNLAGNLNEQGKYAEAGPLFEKALAIRRRELGEGHPDTARGYNGLATNLDFLGKHAEAGPLYEKALAIWRRELGEGHPNIALCYFNVAGNLNAQEKHAEAGPLYEKALAIWRRELGEGHPDTARGYDGLASILFAQGKHAEAGPLYEKALAIWRRELGEGHPLTAAGYNNLAVNLTAQGKHAEAGPLFEEALTIRHRALGEGHPRTTLSYSSLAGNLNAQGKQAEARPLFERVLAIWRRELGEGHPRTAQGYKGLASILGAQGKQAEARPLLEKALAISRHGLGDGHPLTTACYDDLASNLGALGKQAEARALFEEALAIRRRVQGEHHRATAGGYQILAGILDAQGQHAEALAFWQKAVMSDDAARLQVAFAGLDRSTASMSPHPALAAVQARLGRRAEAWKTLEKGLGRGLLDELEARQDRRIPPAHRVRLQELTAKLERLDKLAESTPRGLDQAERVKRFEDLKSQRERASIALGEFQVVLMKEYGPLAGEVAVLELIQAALPYDTALVAWVDRLPIGPGAADPDGEHWGAVLRSRGEPAWVVLAGTGEKGLWTDADTRLAGRVRARLRGKPGTDPAELQTDLDRLRAQRLEPLAAALGATADGLPPARRLVVLPSSAMAGLPVEALLAPGDARVVSYTPSATVLKYLRERPRPDHNTGLLALGDPVYRRGKGSAEPPPPPDHGLLVRAVVPGSNAAGHGLKEGDVLLAYDGRPLAKMGDLKVVAEGSVPILVEVWRDGRVSRRELAPGKLGIMIDPRPAAEAIAEGRKIDKVLLATRSGSEVFAPLPGTRIEVEGLAALFRAADRPVRALLGREAGEPELDAIAGSGELASYGFVHLATHGVVDEGIPARSAVILTQEGLPDPLEQVLAHKPAYDGRLSVREIQRTWELKAELVTLSACQTALGRQAGGEGFVGFTQALLMSGARSVCLSLWKVDDTASALLMGRFYANLLGRRTGLKAPMPKAEALAEAKAWLRNLKADEVLALTEQLSGGEVRGKGSRALKPAGAVDHRPYAAPQYWAAFVLSGDPD